MENMNENTPFGSPSQQKPEGDPQGQENKQKTETSALPVQPSQPAVKPAEASSSPEPAKPTAPASVAAATNPPTPAPRQNYAPPTPAASARPSAYVAPQPAHAAGHQAPHAQAATQIPPYQAGAGQRYQQPYQTSQTPPTHTATNQQPAYQASVAAPVAPKKSGGTGKTFLVSFLGGALAVVLGLSGFGIYNSLSASDEVVYSSDGGTIIGSTNSQIIDTSDDDQTLAEAVAEKALPSVVNIDVYTTSSGYGGDMFGYSDSSGELTESSLGSGVILSEDGYIITNYHVIEGGEALEVTVGDDTYQAEVVGSDPSSDIAVIKAKDASGLTPIDIGSSSDLDIGDWVMTIGSPFGLEQSVATGIVSATSRSQIMESSSGETTVYTNLIQTDAAINPGNSGGALVDADGKLIGINTLITSYSGNYSGVGFAIPVDYAIKLAQQIIDGETPSHAQLGVSLSTVNASVAERYGLSVDSGAYVTQVFKGSGADQAGLEVGDIITVFDGTPVASASDLMLEIRSKNPGDKVSVEINRNGKTETIEVTLGSDAETSQSSLNNSKSYGNSSGGVS